ncbi:endonuclease Exonuclease phosphatase [Micractinium conductrix]|nr:endonuclease Exonuclease phosphatase [Micractinium conductrix]|eukprot:PSC67129.1 endonuclease Exonuclease phosphatase [Micractinium conductrix]
MTWWPPFRPRQPPPDPLPPLLPPEAPPANAAPYLKRVLAESRAVLDADLSSFELVEERRGGGSNCGTAGYSVFRRPVCGGKGCIIDPFPKEQHSQLVKMINWLDLGRDTVPTWLANGITERWYEEDCAAERMPALGQLVAGKGCPTFLLFQEMTQVFHGLLQQQPWFSRYCHTDLPPRAVSFFTLIFWRKDQVSNVVGGTRLRLSITHLMFNAHGHQNNHMAVQQMQAGPFREFNLKHEAAVCPAGWADTWLQLFGDSADEQASCTCDTGVVDQHGSRSCLWRTRLDRCFSNLTASNPQAQWRPLSVERVGLERIPGVQRDVWVEGGWRKAGVWISDHMGLYACFTRT